MSRNSPFVLASVAIAFASSSARGDGADRRAADNSAAGVAQLYLSSTEADRKRADTILDAATPDFLRSVLAQVRAATDGIWRPDEAGSSLEPTAPSSMS